MPERSRQTGGVNTDTAVAETAEFIDDAARDSVRVSGADAQSYLQSQLAQEVRDLEVGAARWTFVLAPTGKIDTLARLTRTEETEFVLDTDAGYGEAMLARVNRFKIRVDAVTELEPAATTTPSADHEAARIAAGWPRMGNEIEPGSTIPATTGVVTLAANFQKGCYPGQELVERMDSRGADAPKSLRVVDLTDGQVVGSPIVDADGNEVGSITSAANGVGVGYVKRGSDVGRVPVQLT
jgi:folate-binding protein YgfZ